jgi:hypothetical protein
MCMILYRSAPISVVLRSRNQEEQMSRKMLMTLLLGVVALSALISVAPASATTWNSNGSAGGTAFTVSAPASKFTMSGVSAGFGCTGPRATGKLYGPTGALTSPVASLTLAFTGCIMGGFTWTANCTTDGLALGAASYAAPTLTGDLRAASARICTFTLPSLPGCTLVFSATNGILTTVANATYNNTTGTLTISNMGQALTASWSGCSTWFGSSSGSAAATLTDNTGANLTYRVTSAFVPNITI